MNQPPTPTPPPPPGSAPTPAPAGNAVATPGRVRPRLVVAIAVATVLLAGIVGLVIAAVVGNDDSPSSDRLQAPLDIDAPAVATVPDDASTLGSVAAQAAPPPPVAADGSTGDEPVGDDGVAAVPVDSIDSPTDDAELPPLASSPVELPELVPPPPTASTVAASAIGDLSPDAVAALSGWEVVEQRADYAAFSDGTVVVEIFAVDGAADGVAPTDAGVTLTEFLDDRLADAEHVTVSETAPQAAARPEFTSVAGAEYVAVTAGQQGTRTMSGAAIAAVDSSGASVVVTTSREGRASDADLAADAELLQAVLAHVDIDIT